MKKTSVVLSVVALVLSLFSLYVSCMNPTKDSTSNLIATLGVLCTVLIGWQIFSLINLFQYEKRMKELESGIEESKTNLNDAMVGAYKNMKRSEGLMYHALADIFQQMGNKSYNSPESCLLKQITWLLAEIEICLYTQDIKELKRTKSDIANAINSNIINPDSFKVGIKEQWNGIKERFQISAFAKPEIILEEIDCVSQLIDSL